MSFKATNWAVSQRGISPAAKVLLWQLADRHNPDNGCFPDQRTIEVDCEMSRSTVNEKLKELEQGGLIKRVKRRNPATKRQMPTRYFFAFEDGYEGVIGRDEDGEADADADESRVQISDTDAPESRVRISDTENEPSRVRFDGQAVSDLAVEPCPTDRTHNRSLTSKITSKVTGKRAERAGSDLGFDKIWKLFPMRTGSNPELARVAFEALDDVDQARCVKGVERFAAHFREKAAASPKGLDGELQYVKYLSNWIAEQGWIAAAALPVKYAPGSDAAQAMEGLENVSKFAHPALFAACERVLGRSLPVGGSGTRSFAKEVVEKARKLLGSQSGASPP